MNMSMSLPMNVTDGGSMTLSISNVMTETVSLYPFLKQIGEKLHLSQECISSMVIALEEQLMNAVRYAYPRGEEGLITLKARWQKATNTLKFTLTDHGTAYNPTEPAASRSERPLGALGINMLSRLMDTVDYVRRAGANILSFTKKFYPTSLKSEGEK